MIGAIAGDIIGSRFEGHPGPPAGFELFHPDCRFTDDTVCTLAVADAIMRKADFASTLRAFVRRYPDAGYGGMFLRWAFTDGAPAYGSWGNGAPMRVSAAGWLAKDQNKADAFASRQAEVSHNHPDAMRGAQAVARTILALRRGAAAADVRAQVVETYGYELRPEVALSGGGFDISASGTVPPAMAAAFESTDWEDAVRTAVCLGGDTDTLACICGAVAEAMPKPENQRMAMLTCASRIRRRSWTTPRWKPASIRRTAALGSIAGRPSPHNPKDRFHEQPRMDGISVLAKAEGLDDRPRGGGQGTSGQGCSPLSATLNQNSH